MAASATHRGWRYSPNNGILSAIYTGAKGGAAALGANTALDGVLLGTPVVPALAVDSIVISNLVASGDFLLALNRGGNSENYIVADASAGTLGLYAPNGAITLTPTSDLILANGTGIIVGATTQVTVSDGDGTTNMIPEAQVLGTAAADGSLLVASFNTTNTRAVSPHIALVKGAAATQVATTAVADNEVVGSIIAYGSDGTDFESPVAAIEFVVDDASGPTTGEMGGSIEFYTTADGGETLTAVMTLDSSQNVIIGNGNGLLVGNPTGVTAGALSEFQVLGTALADGSAILGLFAASALAPDMQFVKGRGATIGSLTIVQDNDEVGRLVWLPADGADLATEAAVFQAEVDDSSPAAGDVGMAFVWESMAGGGAAIAERMRLSAAGDLSIANGAGLIIGTATQYAAGAVTSELQMHGTAPADSTALLAAWSADAVPPRLYFAKSRGAAIGTFSIITTGDNLGEILAFGDDGVDFNSNGNASCAIIFDSAGTIAADRVPGQILLQTATDAQPSVLTTALTISPAQLATFAAGIQGNTRVDVGITGTTTGIVAIDGATTGTVSVTVAATAGTWTLTLPATAGETGDVLVSDGTGISSWVAGMRSVDVQLTNAQLLALLGTDVTLVAAPGANRAIVVHAIYLFFDVTTTAYTINAGATTIGYASDGANVATITEAGFLDTVADAGRWYQIGGATATPDIVTPVANAAIVIRKATNDMTGGNAANTLSIRVYYSVVDMVAFT